MSGVNIMSPRSFIGMTLSLASVLLLVGCENSDYIQEEVSSPTYYQELSGKEAYDLVCASCHETGVNGAPRTGHKDDWLIRSWLSESVIYEHAKDGFLEMPAKGGESELDDVTIEKAAEYMLSITFPKAPTSGK